MNSARIAMLFALLLAISLCPQCVPAFDRSTPAAERSAILFSWDGVQRNHLYECLSRNELPNLAKLISEGKMVEMDVVGHQTDTKAGHAQMLTGYERQVTGVFSNGNYKPIPLGHTIFEQLQAQFGKESISTIMLTGKSHHIGSLGPGKTGEVKAKARPNAAKAKQPAPKRNPALGEDDETAAVRPAQRAKTAAQITAATNKEGEPWFLVKRNFTVWDGDQGRNASAVGPKCLEYIDKYGKGRLFAFYHFSDPDHAGHAHGENSRQYNDAIIECDQWLGRIVEKLKASGLYDRTIIYVTADHGFNEGLKSHKNAPYVFLASNDPGLSSKGDQRDVVPTILRAMGADLAKVTPKLPGKPLSGE